MATIVVGSSDTGVTGTPIPEGKVIKSYNGTQSEEMQKIIDD